MGPGDDLARGARLTTFTADDDATAPRVTVRTAVSVARQLARPVFGAAVTLIIVIALWFGLVKAFALDPLVAKSPADVWHYLLSGSAARTHRAHVFAGLFRTLGDAAVGYAAGLAAALGVALTFAVARGAAQALLPMAILVRSVPLVAMTPLLTLIFGRGIVATSVIAGTVVFFPALVTMAFGLRSAPQQSVDVCRAYGGGTWAVMRKVMLPSALPAISAGARVGVPGAIAGAMLAEWLATGRGLGYAMLQDADTFDYGDLWASAALLTGVSVVCYHAIAVAESAARQLMFAGPARHES